MSQKTAITLTDAESTPVARVFNPAKQDGIVYRWDNRASGIIANYDQLTISERLPVQGTTSTKVQMKLVTPILEVTSPSTASGIQPAPTVAYSLIGELSFTLPARSNLQDRKNLLAMMRDLIDEALTTECVENYDATYF